VCLHLTSVNLLKAKASKGKALAYPNHTSNYTLLAKRTLKSKTKKISVLIEDPTGAILSTWDKKNHNNIHLYNHNMQYREGIK
jgi:predicted ribonuclease toxin of YeeF-YezG toxin-antitoxin module